MNNNRRQKRALIFKGFGAWSDLHTIFQDDLRSNTVLSRLEIVSRQKITPAETLLLLDEIQACPRTLMALRYLYSDDFNFGIILAIFFITNRERILLRQKLPAIFVWKGP